MVDYKYTVAAVLFASFSAAALAGPPSYTLTSFDVPGATASNGGTVPNGINDRGAVVGVYGNGSRESGFLYSGASSPASTIPKRGSSHKETASIIAARLSETSLTTLH